ncbi:hypothetical protein GCM10023235_76480 [Kitasatospora terrestris]|uniref:Uncharacterized protein n=1 Tax=Kitasatospora terrestris TaxID=258051 RepID=A0ABP9ERI0_9ACTN
MPAQAGVGTPAAAAVVPRPPRSPANGTVAAAAANAVSTVRREGMFMIDILAPSGRPAGRSAAREHRARREGGDGPVEVVRGREVGEVVGVGEVDPPGVGEAAGEAVGAAVGEGGVVAADQDQGGRGDPVEVFDAGLGGGQGLDVPAGEEAERVGVQPFQQGAVGGCGARCPDVEVVADGGVGVAAFDGGGARREGGAQGVERGLLPGVGVGEQEGAPGQDQSGDPVGVGEGEVEGLAAAVRGPDQDRAFDVQCVQDGEQVVRVRPGLLRGGPVVLDPMLFPPQIEPSCDV